VGKLLQRVVTGVILAGLVLGVLLYLPPAVATGGVALFLVVAAWEWAAFVAPRSVAARGAYTAAVAGLVLLVALLPPTAAVRDAILLGALVWWAFAFGWVLRFPTPIGTPVIAIVGLLVLLPPFVGLEALLASGTRGAPLVVLLLAIVWAADIGAFFAGRRFGRVRLAPAVSPGKTWEGVGGGLVAAGFAGAAGAVLLGLPALPAVAAALAVAAISIVGDLTESMFKRHAGVKDSGSLFPGHGGVLDRVDSIAAAVPLFVILFQWLGLARP
jgi:phosphatidate cytidylyltransferase